MLGDGSSVGLRQGLEGADPAGGVHRTATVPTAHRRATCWLVASPTWALVATISGFGSPTCALVATITGFGSPTWALVATIGVLERELRQDFLPLGKMLDRLRADLVEAPVQALAQDPGARRGGVEPRQEHEVRALLVEAQRLG